MESSAAGLPLELCVRESVCCERESVCTHKDPLKSLAVGFLCSAAVSGNKERDQGELDTPKIVQVL